MLLHHNYFPKHNSLKTDFPVETKIIWIQVSKIKYLHSLRNKRSLHGNRKVQMNADEGEVIAVQLLLLFNWSDSQKTFM